MRVKPDKRLGSLSYSGGGKVSVPVASIISSPKVRHQVAVVRTIAATQTSSSKKGAQCMWILEARDGHQQLDRDWALIGAYGTRAQVLMARKNRALWAGKEETRVVNSVPEHKT